MLTLWANEAIPSASVLLRSNVGCWDFEQAVGTVVAGQLTANTLVTSHRITLLAEQEGG